jgi:FMN-dependent NADH-azoreductase
MKLLHISSSPRAAASESLGIADAFVAAYRLAHPTDEVDRWDLWDGSLPDFAVGARAKMTVFSGVAPEGEEADAWRAAERVFRRFDSADRLLFSVPMWNGSIPYVLKQFIDVVSQPGWIFEVDPATGYRHLLAGKDRRVAVVYTSAVWGPHLGPAFGTDFQSSYFNDWLKWAGLADVTEVRFHPTLTGDWDNARLAAHARARKLAAHF